MARLITDITNSKSDQATVYPRGYVVDAEGSEAGSTVGEPMVGDMLQFFSKLMADASPSISPNSLPDNETNGYQLFQAFINYIRNVLVATETAKGTVEKATTTERDAATADKFIDASLLKTMTATTSRTGIVEKATESEAGNGTPDKYIDAELFQNANNTNWQTPSFNSGFSADSSDPFEYRLNRGKLEFRGSILSSASTSGTAFTLSSAYRPQVQVFIPKFNLTSGYDISAARVRADGQVSSLSWTLSSAGSNSFNTSIILD